jgi:hypothetical protein
MDIFIYKHRILCLIRLCIAYVATNIEVSYLRHLLAFDSSGGESIEEFLTKLGCKIVEGKLMCKESSAALKRAPLKLKQKTK